MLFQVKRFEELTGAEVYAILRARAQVFVCERDVVCLDPDGEDANALHCFWEEDGNIVAYLRAIPEAGDPTTVRISRVLTTARGKGWGKLLIKSSVAAIRRTFGAETVLVHSQTGAEGFYARCGFESVSAEFEEDHARRIAMTLAL